MPLYNYGCKNKDHPRVELAHSWDDIGIEVFCSVCGQPMHRIPQAFTWSWHPSHALLDTMERKYTTWRTKELKKRKAQKS